MELDQERSRSTQLQSAADKAKVELSMAQEAAVSLQQEMRLLREKLTSERAHVNRPLRHTYSGCP